MFTEKIITADEFVELVEQPPYSEGLFELIDGRIVEKMPTEEHGLAQINIGTALNLYRKAVGKGRPGSEVLNRVPGDPKNARQPDVSFFVEPTEPVVTRGAVPRLPDLCVVIQSPSNTVKQMREKAAYYLAHGTQMVWIVYTEQRLVEVCHREGYTASDR